MGFPENRAATWSAPSDWVYCHVLGLLMGVRYGVCPLKLPAGCGRRFLRDAQESSSHGKLIRAETTELGMEESGYQCGVPTAGQGIQ